LGLWQSWGQGFEPPQLHQNSTDTGQAVPGEDRLPRRPFDPDSLKEPANHHLAFFGFPRNEHLREALERIY